MTAGPDPSRPYYQVDPNMDRHIPNHISASERWWNFGLSLLIIAWGSYGLWADDLIVPVSKRGNAIHLHGTAAVIMFCAMVAAALNLLMVIVDHIDIRNNELTYRRIAVCTQFVAWVLFVAAILCACCADPVMKYVASRARPCPSLIWRGNLNRESPANAPVLRQR
jgi:hypothetical protein